MTKLLRFNEVVKMVGLGRTSLWRLEKDDKFPRRIKIGERAVAWDKQEIDQWLEKQKEQRG